MLLPEAFSELDGEVAVLIEVLNRDELVGVETEGELAEDVELSVEDDCTLPVLEA